MKKLVLILLLVAAGGYGAMASGAVGSPGGFGHQTWQRMNGYTTEANAGGLSPSQFQPELPSGGAVERAGSAVLGTCQRLWRTAKNEASLALWKLGF